MVGGDQGGRSSRPRSIHKGWRAKLRRLDQRCTAAEKLMEFQMAVGRNWVAAQRVYQKADMERMMIRNKIKSYARGESNGTV